MLKPLTYVPLWEGPAPLANGTADADIPAVEMHLPSSGPPCAAMIVCPGGGYEVIVDHEKRNVAEWLNTLGITAFILRYRVAPYHHPCQIMDVTRAMRFVRHHAPAHGLDPHRVGIIGFSAGGHLASTIATHFDSGNPTAIDPIEREPSRPDLHVLLYPVITMLAGCHPGSYKNLLGENPSPEAAQLLSNHLRVTPQTPPAFLVHAIKDQEVTVMHSDLYAEALQKAGVPHEYMRGDFGGHGFSLQRFWTEPCATWLRDQQGGPPGTFARVKRFVERIGQALRRLRPCPRAPPS